MKSGILSTAERYRYVSTIALVLFATGLETVLKNLVGQPMLFFYLAVTSVTATLFGIWPGIISVLLGCAAWDFVLPSTMPFSEMSGHSWIRLMFFIPTGLLIAALGGSLRSALSNLKREREFREKLVASIAHDLRSPLTTAKMTLDILGRRTDQENSKRVRRASRALDRADSLIQDFLDFSFRHSGRERSLQIEVCNLTELLRDAATDYEITHPGRVKFTTQYDNLILNCDKRALRRAADNLIANALKYGSRDSEVTVSIQRLSDFEIVIIVHNWGNPISPEEQERLFLYFEKHSQEPSIEGWGIGLATVKSMIEAHHGSVAVRSNGTTGTSFIIRLPVRHSPGTREIGEAG